MLPFCAHLSVSVILTLLAYVAKVSPTPTDSPFLLSISKDSPFLISTSKDQTNEATSWGAQIHNKEVLLSHQYRQNHKIKYANKKICSFPLFSSQLAPSHRVPLTRVCRCVNTVCMCMFVIVVVFF